MNRDELREFLEEKADLYNRPEFIQTDPILIPRSFSGRENQEISGFLASSIAWGNRVSILKNANRLMALMDNDPFSFLTRSTPSDRNSLFRFVHRTINGEDMLFFAESLRNIYLHHGGLETVFTKSWQKHRDMASVLADFHRIFFSLPHLPRSRRPIADVSSVSASKRINLFLRWMVRSDEKGVDLGIWKKIPASALMLPLDVHTGRVARRLGLLERRQNDWKAVEEVTAALRGMDPADPVKYDFALFGLGIFEGFA
jgi:uncharacterized protein (TIGR02757 family)